jgi:Raf kinase inhibitor-like YbhB/YbcL family protein
MVRCAVLTVVSCMALAMSGCGDGTAADAGTGMTLSSAAFAEGERIPKKHTCDGENVSPPLDIAGVPDRTRSLALIMDDPDAPRGTWVHWVVWNIPPDTKAIPEGTEPKGVAGKNSFGKTGYGGPCPPKGPAHRYYFKLYALDAALDLPAGSTKDRLEQAMKGHVIARASLMGTYSR